MNDHHINTNHLVSFSGTGFFQTAGEVWVVLVSHLQAADPVTRIMVGVGVDGETGAEVSVLATNEH